MIKNKLTRLLALTAVSTAMLSSTTFAEDVIGSASVEVQNSFDLVETTPLSFGVISATAAGDGSDFASLQIHGDGSVPTITQGAALASIVSVTDGVAGQFTVSNAAPNTVLTISPIGDFQLTDPSGVTDTKVFDIVDVVTTIVTSGSGNTFTYDTDATGTLVFNVGATLQTDVSLGGGAGTTEAYQDITFTGSYTVTVNY